MGLWLSAISQGGAVCICIVLLAFAILPTEHRGIIALLGNYGAPLENCLYTHLGFSCIQPHFSSHTQKLNLAWGNNIYHI